MHNNKFLFVLRLGKGEQVSEKFLIDQKDIVVIIKHL